MNITNMIKRLKYIIFIALILLLSACAITPEEEERKELTPALKYIEAPKNVLVISDCINGRIELSWDEVPNATHYIVEYQSATDYLSDKAMKTYVTNTNSFTLSTFPNANDKRFVFRVRALSKQTSRVIESESSELFEGAIVDDFTVSTNIKSSKLSFYSSFAKNSSILGNGNIIDCQILYFDGDYTQSDLPSLEEASDSFTIGSNETKTITAVLMCNSKVVKKKSVTVTSDVSYIPANIKSISVENNKTDGIHLSWISPGINKGLENTQILFLVERALQGSNNWEIIKPTIDEEYFKPENNDDLSVEQFSMSFVDTSALSNCDYQYRISTVYKIINGENEYYSSEAISDSNIVSNCYRTDSKVKSFVHTNQSGLITAPDGSKSYELKFKWETYHPIPEDCSIVINRKLINTLSSSEIESTLNKEFNNVSSNVFEDTITLTASEAIDPKSFIYTISIKYNDGTNLESPYVATNNSGQSIITFEGLEITRIINSLSATTGANAVNDKIRLAWTVESFYPEDFNTSNVTYTIYKQNPADMTYSKEKENIPFETHSYELNVKPGESFSYLIKPVYSDTSDNKYVRDYPTTGPAVGSALNLVTNLKASQNTYNDKIVLNWDSVENAKGYKVCYLDKEVETLDTRYEITDIPIDRYGTEIKIKVKTIDCEDRISNDGSTTIGKILGGITPTVNGNAKDIDVTWNAVDGATKYKVNVYTAFQAETPIISTIVSAGSTLSFKLTSDDVLAIEGLVEPLSNPYYFSVIPYVGQEPSKAEDRVEGHWLLAPKNVTATKATYKDMIDITWDSVEGANAYVVYYRVQGSNSWNTTTVFSTSCKQYDVEDIFEYRVATLDNQMNEGPASLVTDSSIGYVLMRPIYCSGTDEKNGLYSIRFNKIEAATSYTLSIPNWDNTIIPINPKSETDKTSNFESEDLTYSNGFYTYYFAKQDLSTGVSIVVEINSNKDSVESKYTPVTIVAESLNANEVVNLANYSLRDIFAVINSAFEGDWWSRTAATIEDREVRTYESADGKIKANNSSCANLIGTKQAYGKVTISNYRSGSIVIENANLTTMATDGGTLGYSDTDPFGGFASGSLTITMPYNLGTYDVVYSGFKNDLTGGSATVKKSTESEVQPVDATKTKIRIL